MRSAGIDWLHSDGLHILASMGAAREYLRRLGAGSLAHRPETRTEEHHRYQSDRQYGPKPHGSIVPVST